MMRSPCRKLGIILLPSTPVIVTKKVVMMKKGSNTLSQERSSSQRYRPREMRGLLEEDISSEVLGGFGERVGSVKVAPV